MNDAFALRFAKIAARNQSILDELDLVLCALEEERVEALPLKGADLIGRAYGGSLGLRPMVDADILFKPEDLPAIYRLLESRSFRQKLDGNPSLVSPSGLLSLDLISEIWYLPNTREIWRRSVPRILAGKIRPALHPEDSLTYLLAYQALHRARLDPQTAFDAAALIRAEGSLIDWDRWLRSVEACSLSVPVHHALSYVRSMEPSAVPNEIIERLRPSGLRRPAAALLRRWVTEQDRPGLGHLLILVTRPTWGSGLASLWRAFFPDRSFMEYRYGPQHWIARAWTRCSRPFILVFQGIRAVLRSVRI